MLKILIVEDDQHKLMKVTRALTDVRGIEFTRITTATNSHDAKLILEKENFDLMILDIALPNRIDSNVTKNGGLELLEEIEARDKYNLPAHIIGITAHKEVHEENRAKFSDQLLHLVFYDVASEDWARQLQTRVKQILDSKMDIAPDANNFQSKLAVVCALKDPELESVLVLDWDWHEINIPGDATRYFEGSYRRDDKINKVYAAAASRMGMPATAILAMKMIAAFKPEYIAMTGIAAGVPTKTNYGDVIAVDASWDWGSGKWTIDDGHLKFSPSPHYQSLSVDLRNNFLRLKDDVASLSVIRQKWKADKPAHVLELKLGPMASGAAVLADGTTMQRLLTNNRDLIGVEMETYAIFAAAVEAPAPRPVPFALKSVVDFADGNKNDTYQRYAAYTSAEILKLFMEEFI